MLLLILLGWLGPKLPARRQYVQSTPKVRILSPADATPAPEATATPKPTPKQTQTPKPTPKRTPTPRPETPKPTIKPTLSAQKTISVSKQTVTPTPSPIPENHPPTPVPIKKNSAKKEIVETPSPTPSPSPSPSPRKTPDLKTPKAEVKETTLPTPEPRRTPKQITSATPEITPYAGRSSQNNNATSFNVEDASVNLPENYMLDAANRLQQNFKVPRNAQSSVKSCVISFRIKSDGTIYDVKVERSTNFTGLDRLALRAVNETGTLLPIASYTERSDIKATVRFVFGSSD